MGRTHTLITIPFSHFCEKARWALDLLRPHGTTYVERGHLPFFSRRATLRHRARQVPVWVTPNEVVRDSTDILAWANARLPGRPLYPSADALTLEERPDKRLGPDVRRVAYFHLLAAPQALDQVIADAPVPTIERRLFALPPVRLAAISLMRRGLGIDPARAQRSTERLFATLNAMDERLARHAYLAGDTFTAADLTFAALASPLLMPPQHPRGWPAPATIPSALAELMRRVADTRAGQHALAMYARHR